MRSDWHSEICCLAKSLEAFAAMRETGSSEREASVNLFPASGHFATSGFQLSFEHRQPCNSHLARLQGLNRFGTHSQRFRIPSELLRYTYL
jgi:hypothetical protein